MIAIQHSEYEKIEKLVTGYKFSKIKNNFPQDAFSDYKLNPSMLREML